MGKEIFKKLSEHKELILIKFGIIVGLLLLVLTVSIGVDIFNKIKEGKYIGKPPELQNTISFTGKGEVFIKPDLALITFAVQNEAKTVTEAVAENAKKINAVIDSMKNLGVESKDLKTASFNISPRYEWHEEEVCLSYPCPQGKRVLMGYEVYQSLQVKVRNLEKVGPIIQSATDMGANDVSGLQFTVDDEDEFKNQARKMAIEEAKTKAKELAQQLGVNLVRITNFSESGSSPVPYYALEKAAGIGGAAPSAPQIETGENKIEIIVTISYEIN